MASAASLAGAPRTPPKSKHGRHRDKTSPPSVESRPGKRREQEGCPPAAIRQSLLFPSTRDKGAGGGEDLVAATVAASFAALEAGAPQPPGAADAAEADAQTSRPSTERSRNNDTGVAECEKDNSDDDGGGEHECYFEV